MISITEFYSLLANQQFFTTASISTLSEDTSNHQTMIDSDQLGINYDFHAKKFARKFNVCRPASCDGLFQFTELNAYGEVCFLFVEFKNGNILTQQNGTKQNYEIKKDELKSIRNKLYDSAIMLTLEADLPMSFIRTHFSVVIVVNEQQLGEESDNVKMSLPQNPLENDLLISAINLHLSGSCFITELIYSTCEVVDKTNFEKEWMATIKKPSLN